MFTLSVAIMSMDRKRIAITIGASEVAACIGRNPYKSPEDVITSLWSKYHPEKGIKTDTQKAKDLLATSEIGKSLVSELKQNAGSIAPSDLQNQVKEIKDKLKTTFKAEDKKLVDSYIQSKANTVQGTKCEDRTAIKLVETGECTHLVEDSTFYRLPLLQTDLYTFTIVGKIDRMDIAFDGTKTLIEIKNRAKRLFGEVKEYEFVQVQTYLQMVGLDRAKLVEQYPQSNELNVFPIEKDQQLWEGTYLLELLEFCKRVESEFVEGTEEEDV